MSIKLRIQGQGSYRGKVREDKFRRTETINEHDIASKIFPNPIFVGQQLNIPEEAIGHEIYSLNGNLVVPLKMSNQPIMYEISSGVYFIKIIYPENKWQFQKLLVY